MKKNRWMAWLLAGAMAASMAACGGKAEPAATDAPETEAAAQTEAAGGTEAGAEDAKTDRKSTRLNSSHR